MKKYTVIYRSVLMENLQYTANVAMGFVSYFVFIFIFCHQRNTIIYFSTVLVLIDPL